MAPRPVVLVTGCSGGIGHATALHLHAQGCIVVATARRPEAIADLAEAGMEVEALDVTHEADRRRVVAAVMARHGRIDAVVNNAGFGAIAAAEETTPDLLQRMFDTNLFGGHELTRLALPIMRDQGHGRIVNVSSVAGHIPIPMQSAYCATKFALRAMTMVMDVEVRDFGIRACLIEPGWVNTDFGKRSTKETQQTVRDGAAGPYARFHDKWARRRAKGGHGAPPERIAEAIGHACLAKRPRMHYFEPFHAKAFNVAKRVLPDAVLMHQIRRKFNP